jgi:ubiquilin
LLIKKIKSVPGGFNALSRIYREVQEPMMNAAFSQNPFAALLNNNNSNTSTENRMETF